MEKKGPFLGNDGVHPHIAAIYPLQISENCLQPLKKIVLELWRMDRTASAIFGQRPKTAICLFLWRKIFRKLFLRRPMHKQRDTVQQKPLCCPITVVPRQQTLGCARNETRVSPVQTDTKGHCIHLISPKISNIGFGGPQKRMPNYGKATCTPVRIS